MANKQWRLKDGQQEHVIFLKHGYFSGKREIFVDDKLVASGQSLIEFGNDYPIPFPGNRSVVVRINTNGLTYKYDLIVDEISQESGRRVEPIGPVPAWVWIFVVAEVALVFLGGAIGGALGAVAAYLSVTIARNPALSIFNRVVFCLGAAVLAWVGYLVIAGAIVRPMFR
jgi:hypothetical protein